MSNIITPGRDGRAVQQTGETRGKQQIVAKPFLVCDLDGTLRYPKGDPNPEDPEGFINEPDEIAFYEGVIDTVWGYRDDGWAPVIVSNQAGVAHGHMEKKDLDRQYNRMQELAREQSTHGRGWPFLDCRFCMYDDRADHPMYGYRSLNRKPRYGALAGIENRAKTNGVVPMWDQSVMIGDRPEDEQMAEAAGLDFWPAQEWRAAIKEERPELGGGDDE